MDAFIFSAQCKVRQCSQCQGDTEYYCNHYEEDLCLQCKERHVIDIGTMYHDVVIYREKYGYITKQETCVRHKDKVYEMYCKSCELSFCSQCTEHRKHQIVDIRIAYKAYRNQTRNIINHIRRNTICKGCCILTEINTDVKSCHTEISKRQSAMSTKASRLKNLIYDAVRNVKMKNTSYMIQIFQQKREMNRYISRIETYELRSELSANKPVQFLLFVKKTLVLKVKEAPNLTQHELYSSNAEINMKDVIKLISEIKIIEKGKRQERSERLLKMFSRRSPRYVTVQGVNSVDHISCLSLDKYWISDWYSLILINKAGSRIHQLRDIASYGGVHTVNINSQLIYIDRYGNINKLSKDNKTQSLLIARIGPWRPQCVYSSPFSGDLLVGMWNVNKKTGKVTRYIEKNLYLQPVQHNACPELYQYPRYITENLNGDVIVSNIIDIHHGDVVVTDHGGGHRFSYTGTAGLRFDPRGICTDELSHIFVCDNTTNTIHVIDKDGFLLILIMAPEGIYSQQGLGYNEKCHGVCVGSMKDNRVSVCEYIFMRR